MLEEYFYFVASENIEGAWTSFASTEMVSLGISIQELEKVIIRLGCLYEEPGRSDLRQAVVSAEETLRYALVRIFRTERETIHFRNLQVVYPRGGGKPYLELELYTATVRLPVEWLLEVDPELAAKIGEDLPALNLLSPLPATVGC